MNTQKTFIYLSNICRILSKNRHTVVTGCGMPTGTKTGNRTRTRVTRNCDTAVIPAPVRNPRFKWLMRDLVFMIMGAR